MAKKASDSGLKDPSVPTHQLAARARIAIVDEIGVNRHLPRVQKTSATTSTFRDLLAETQTINGHLARITDAMHASDAINFKAERVSGRSDAQSRRTGASRASQPSTMLMKVVNTKFTEIQHPCDNCEKTHKKGERCDQRCAACGEDGHAFAICPQKENACLCEEYPYHTRENCTSTCVYCIRRDRKAPHHRAFDCDEMCHVCLSGEHKTRACPDYFGENKRERGPCMMCSGDKWHLASNCGDVVCPVQECRTPLDCEIHCVGCGYEKELDGRRGMDKQKCEWIKSMAVPEMPTLFCKEHPEHLVSADSPTRLVEGGG